MNVTLIKDDATATNTINAVYKAGLENLKNLVENR